jgi:hypothetical protein
MKVKEEGGGLGGVRRRLNRDGSTLIMEAVRGDYLFPKLHHYSLSFVYTGRRSWSNKTKTGNVFDCETGKGDSKANLKSGVFFPGDSYADEERTSTHSTAQRSRSGTIVQINGSARKCRIQQGTALTDVTESRFDITPDSDHGGNGILGCLAWRPELWLIPNTPRRIPDNDHR